MFYQNKLSCYWTLWEYGSFKDIKKLNSTETTESFYLSDSTSLFSGVNDFSMDYEDAYVFGDAGIILPFPSQ